MLTKYRLIHVPSGGVDHLLDGHRVRINQNLTNEQADRLKALGLPYFQLIEPITPTAELPAPTHGEEESPTNPPTSPRRSRKRAASGQFTKAE
ncbi:hypothetical protein GCM10027347_17590 [Larkinella harenae]